VYTVLNKKQKIQKHNNVIDKGKVFIQFYKCWYNGWSIFSKVKMISSVERVSF